MYGGPQVSANGAFAQQPRQSYAPLQNANYDQHEPLPGFSGQAVTYPRPMETQAFGSSKPRVKP